MALFIPDMAGHLFLVILLFAGSTVSSTLTPNTPVRPTTNRPTKCLTSPLTPSTALNPTSGQSSTDIVVNSNSQESIPESSTGTSTLTPGITVRPTTNLTYPLTPSTAVNPTSGGQSSTESVVEPAVQLWQGALGVASGVGVFLMGLTAVCLWRRTKKTNSQRPTARQDDHSQFSVLDDLVMGAVSSAGVLDSRDAGIYSLINTVPSTLLPSCPVEENGQSSEKDNSDMYHVYSSIPDRPGTSAQPDGLYSLLQAH